MAKRNTNAKKPKRLTDSRLNAGIAISPLGPRNLARIAMLPGVELATFETGIKYKNRADLLLAIFAPGTQFAGVFTKSKTSSAPVDWCRAQLKHGQARALVVNSGNANAFTGKAGYDSVRKIAENVSAMVDCKLQQVLIASTGVIGEPLPVNKITDVLGDMSKSAGTFGWRDAASAIMTTDTYPKMATVEASIDGRRVAITGIAKGSGMIAPNMATLLAFVFTDAKLPADVLQDLLEQGVEPSFNSITVDGDTSTSDTLLLFATGKSAPHKPVLKLSDKHLSDFREKFDSLLLELALQVVKDGEGATKLIQVDVTGAESDASAKRIAFSIANSVRVKTAIAGGDPNWGRIVMAVGKSGEPADRDRLKIKFGDHIVAENGQRARKYDKIAVTKAISKGEVHITVDIGLGNGLARVWTCDLTHGYFDKSSSYVR
jgi:glutamate N-acetyltransferase/amino-acid N-acetyltransferase